MFDYIHDPEEIRRRSIEAIRSEVNLDAFPEDIRPVAERMVHACGMPDIVADLDFSTGAAAAGRAALADGAPVLTDSEMLRAGIIRDRLPAGNETVCTLNAKGVAQSAKAAGTTRSAAAVDLWRPMLEGAVVAIGNAPTALFHLLELLAAGAGRPALVIGFPVGFIGAAESKGALIAVAGSVHYITLQGRRGGSALAAAAVNALTGNEG